MLTVIVVFWQVLARTCHWICQSTFFSYARTSWKAKKPSTLSRPPLLASHTHVRVESKIVSKGMNEALARFSHACTSWKIGLIGKNPSSLSRFSHACTSWKILVISKKTAHWSRFSHACTSWKIVYIVLQLFFILASHTHVRVESLCNALIYAITRLASHTHVRVESGYKPTHVSRDVSLLTRMYELKEPVYNPLILNALDLTFREPVTFILYD